MGSIKNISFNHKLDDDISQGKLVKMFCNFFAYLIK
jgi:hypothetical protein